MRRAAGAGCGMRHSISSTSIHNMAPPGLALDSSQTIRGVFVFRGGKRSAY
jgi:hypothetical protein